MIDDMGIFRTTLSIAALGTPNERRDLANVMVDTGSEFTWIDGAALKKIGIEARKKDLQIQMANGQIITRSVGYAILKVGRAETIDEVVFAQEGDLQLLGCRALEGLNLRVDSRAKKLVAAGPIIAATAIKVRCKGAKF